MFWRRISARLWKRIRPSQPRPAEGAFAWSQSAPPEGLRSVDLSTPPQRAPTAGLSLTQPGPDELKARKTMIDMIARYGWERSGTR